MWAQFTSTRYFTPKSDTMIRKWPQILKMIINKIKIYNQYFTFTFNKLKLLKQTKKKNYTQLVYHIFHILQSSE